jgi:hypothetical protein
MQILLSLAVGVLVFVLARHVNDREMRRARRGTQSPWAKRCLQRAAVRLTAFAHTLRTRRIIARARRELEKTL